MKNPAHLRFIRSLPCVVCGAQSEAHHLIGHGQGGMGMKSCDYFAMPLCSAHHRQLHDHGWKTFEEMHGYQWRFSAGSLRARVIDLEAQLQTANESITDLRKALKASREKKAA